MHKRSRLFTAGGAIAVLALGLGLSGCSSDDNAGGNTKTTNAPAASTSTPPAVTTFNGVIPDPTHVSVKADAGGQQLTISGDVNMKATPQKANISLDVSNMTIKMILVDGKLYMQQPGTTTWQDLGAFTPKPSITGDNSSDPKGLFNIAMALIQGGSESEVGSIAAFTKNVDMQSNGSETVDGVECTRWLGKDASGSTAEFWVDPDGNDAKIVLDSGGTGAATVGTWEFTNRGKDFTVEAPSTK